MKKRVILFLLVLCAALCLAFSAMADYPSSAPLILGSKFTDAEILKALKMEQATNTNGNTVQLKSGDNAQIKKVLNGQEVIIGNDNGDKLYVIYNFVSYSNPTKITIKNGVTLQSSHTSEVVIECPIINYGTIDSFTHQGKNYNTATYSGTIQNWGRISGGTFTGTVINMPGGTITGGDFSKATLYVQDDSGKQTEITAPSSEHPEFNYAWITVTLDPNGGTLPEGTATTQTIRCGASLTSAAPTKEGKQFAYWEDQYGNYYSNDAISCLHNDTTVTLKAVWCDFLVIYEMASPESGANDMGKTMLPQAFNIGEEKALEECIFKVFASDNKYNSPHYFYCWNTRADGLGENYFVHYSYEFKAEESGSITLYPRWLKASINTAPPYCAIQIR